VPAPLIRPLDRAARPCRVAELGRI